MLRDNLELGSGLVRFYSKDNARAYMETLLEYYKTRLEEHGQQLAELLRDGAEPASETPMQSAKRESKDSKKNKDAPKVLARGWSKVGSLPVNLSDTKKALAEVSLRIVDDYKSRVDKISEALKSFNEVDSLGQVASPSFTLFVYRGVPEAVIVSPNVKKQEMFAFTASFKAV